MLVGPVMRSDFFCGCDLMSWHNQAMWLVLQITRELCTVQRKKLGWFSGPRWSADSSACHDVVGMFKFDDTERESSCIMSKV